jgi:hypothetical protein
MEEWEALADRLLVKAVQQALGAPAAKPPEAERKAAP